MRVVFLSPSYPPEMIEYTRGLKEVGAEVYGVGDSPRSGLPASVQSNLTDYLQVSGLMNEDHVVSSVKQWLKGRSIDRIEALWEPLVLTAARLRDEIGIPGMSYDIVRGFRDKQLMKERVAQAGLRVPRSRRIRSEDEAWAAARSIGYPLILKPIAGAGSADTYRCNDDHELKRALELTRHIPEGSIEEFIEGEEFTLDTVCIDGEPKYINICQYLPRPLIARTNEWISPVVVTIRDLDHPKYRDGLRLGLGVLKALQMGTGFTHMEWHRKADGEVVFGEIGCRPGGAHIVDQMNYTSDIDLFREWARCVCWKHFASPIERKYNVAIIFKRAEGQGIIRQIHGLDDFKRRFGSWICSEELLPVGSPRRNWKHTLLSDGFLIVRHPGLDEALHMANIAASEIRMYAGH